MKTYNKQMDVVNIIGKAFGQDDGLKDTTIESQLKKHSPQSLDDIFTCVDTVYLSHEHVHILVERQFANKGFMLYSELEDKRDPMGIIKKFSWEHKGIQIEVNAKYDPINKEDPRVKKVNDKIKKYKEAGKIL